VVNRLAPHPPRPSFPTRRSSDLRTCMPNPDDLPRSLGKIKLKVSIWRWLRQTAELLPSDDIRRIYPRLVGRQGHPPYFAGLPLRSEEHTSELQSRENLVCRLLLE